MRARRDSNDLLAGGLRKPLRDTLGLDTQVPIGRVLDALRVDADWLAHAASPEQAAVLYSGQATPSLEPTALWSGTPEGQAQERQEKQRAIQRYTELWGRPPA